MEIIKNWKMWLLCFVVVLVVQNPIIGWCDEIIPTLPIFEEGELERLRFQLTPEKPTMENKFKKDLSIKTERLRFKWKKINTIETRYKFSDSSNLRWNISMNQNLKPSAVALFTIEW